MLPEKKKLKSILLKNKKKILVKSQTRIQSDRGEGRVGRGVERETKILVCDTTKRFANSFMIVIT